MSRVAQNEEEYAEETFFPYYKKPRIAHSLKINERLELDDGEPTNLIEFYEELSQYKLVTFNYHQCSCCLDQ